MQVNVAIHVVGLLYASRKAQSRNHCYLPRRHLSDKRLAIPAFRGFLKIFQPSFELLASVSEIYINLDLIRDAQAQVHWTRSLRQNN